MTLSYPKDIDEVRKNNFMQIMADVLPMLKRFPAGGQHFDLRSIVDYGGLFVQYRFSESVPGYDQTVYTLAAYKVTRELEFWEGEVLHARYYTALRDFISLD